MTWAEFQTLVNVFLTVDADRQGITAFRANLIRQAVIDIQSNVDLYRVGHTSIYQPDDLAIRGSASVGTLPSECQPRDCAYVQTSPSKLLAVPVNGRKPLVPYDWGNRNDLISGNMRISRCRYAICIDPYAREFIVFPAVAEGFHVEVVWDGLKLEFADSDTVPFDESMALAVAKYVKAWICSEVDHDPSMFLMNMGQLPVPNPGTYLQLRQRLFADAKDRKRQKETAASPQPEANCAGVTCPSSPATVVTEPLEVQFAAVGNSGSAATISDTDAVAQLIGRLEADLVLHLGNACDSTEPAAIQDLFTDFYWDWIPDNLFLAFGANDLAINNGDDYLTLLSAMAALNAGKRYYNFQWGPVNFFVYNSGPYEPDGWDVNSVQAAWLQTKLGEATAGWNVVFVNKPPYSSEAGLAGGFADVQLPFKDWGAHLVISCGSTYERLLVDGLQYLICGLGGAAIGDFDAPITGSQFRYNAKNGALRITADASKLQAVLNNTDTEMIDQLTLKP